MNQRPYLTISGAIFALVAVGHLSRAVSGWASRVADYDVPRAASWLAAIVAGALAAWALRLVRAG